jgi:hypothetical protein
MFFLNAAAFSRHRRLLLMRAAEQSTIWRLRSEHPNRSEGCDSLSIAADVRRPSLGLRDFPHLTSRCHPASSSSTSISSFGDDFRPSGADGGADDRSPQRLAEAASPGAMFSVCLFCWVSQWFILSLLFCRSWAFWHTFHRDRHHPDEMCLTTFAAG